MMSEAKIPKECLPESLDPVIEKLVEFVNEKERINSQKRRKFVTIEGEEYMKLPQDNLVPEKYHGQVRVSDRRDYIEYEDFSINITFGVEPEGYSMKYDVTGMGFVQTDLSKIEECIEEYFSTVSFK